MSFLWEDQVRAGVFILTNKLNQPSKKRNLSSISVAVKIIRGSYYFAFHLKVKMEYLPPIVPGFLTNLNSVLEDDVEGIQWITGAKPDYSVVNELYEKGKQIPFIKHRNFSILPEDVETL